MLNSDSFETIESHFLDSATTLVIGNGEAEASLVSDGEEGSDCNGLDLDEDGILIVPSPLEHATGPERNGGSSTSLSLPESVPSTVGSFTVTHMEPSKAKECVENESSSSEEKNSIDPLNESKEIPVTKGILIQPFVALFGYWAFFVLLVFHAHALFSQENPTVSVPSTDWEEVATHALQKVVQMEEDIQRLKQLTYENSALLETNSQLGEDVKSMTIERDNLLVKVEDVEQRVLVSEMYQKREQLKIDLLNTELASAEALNNATKHDLAFVSEKLDKLTQERDTLLVVKRDLEHENMRLKKEKQNATDSTFGWRHADFNLVDNCWLRAQLELGQCADDAKEHVKRGYTDAKDFLLKTKTKYESTFNEFKDDFQTRSSSFGSFDHGNNTSQEEETRTGGFGVFDFEEDIVESVSRRFDYLKNNERIKSVGKVAKSVLSGVAYATAATVVVSGTFLGEVFGNEGGN